MMYLEVGYCVDPVTRQKVDLPFDYILYRLCKDVYHCLPSQIMQEDMDTLLLHLDFYNLEHERASQRPTTG